MIRYLIALWMAKISIVALKITKHAGTNFPGIVALKICPNFLKYAKKPEKVIAVTGTNGKTTTCNIVLDMLTKEGYDVLNNKAGSNIASGISTSLIYGMTFFGKEKHKIGVFEVDERSAKRVFPYLKPDYLLITNLSRDSIMRNAHPEYIANFLTDNIPKDTMLVLNADDMISSNVAKNNKRVYYGISRMDTDRTDCINLINDFQICPKCHQKLKYNYLRYNHIGNAYCPDCDFKSPDADFLGINVNTSAMTMEVKNGDEVIDYKLLNESVHHIYNVVAVVALFKTMGYESKKILELFDEVQITRSRFSEEVYGDKKLFRMLAKEKNAFATTRVFDQIHHMSGDKEIILMNSCQGDMKHWSENTCWLYDCDFEFLNDDRIKNIILCGPRRFDHKLRLKIAGIDDDRITLCEKETDTPEYLKLFENDNVFVLYGTDSLNLGMKVSDKVADILKNGGAK